MTRHLLLWVSLLLSAVTQAQPITVLDGLGREVRLNQPAQRIVALAPHIVENLFSAGAGKHIVGVVEYSNFPAAAQSLPTVGGYTSFSVEAVLALQPDLVVMWDSGSRPEVLEKFEQLGLTVYVDSLKILDDIATSIEHFGVLSGHEAEANTQARDFRQTLSQLHAARKDVEPVSVFYQVWNHPLQTINGEYLISQVISLCGGRNIFADEPVTTPKISIEAVLEANPQAIFASGMGESRPDWLDDWKAYKNLQAVQKNQLFFVPPDTIQRSSLRILTGTGQTCEYLDQVRATNSSP